MAASTTYAYERIYEVLLDGKGANRALAAADRFVRGWPPGFALADRAARAKPTPSVFVVMPDFDPMPGVAGEMTSVHLNATKVMIFRNHWLGFEADPTEVQAQQVKATNAFLKLRAALCWPGNLAQTEESNATGFGSEALSAHGSTSRLVRVANLGNNDRLLQYVDTFPAEFEYSPDA